MKQFQRLAVFLALVLVSALAFAQGTNSNLNGTVKLENNGLPGVTVTISSPALQGTRTAVTDVNGNYNFPALPPGQYTVKFDMESMQTVTKQSLIGLAESARVDAEMRLSAVAEAITVTASAPAVLETTEVQTNLQSKMINELPLSRTFASTANLAPGVTANTPNGNQLAISGAPGSESLYLVNGAEINENVRSQIHNLFIEDAIQEQTVLTGNISAEYGRFSGGVVTAITKSGGNEFSGSFRDNLTNSTWSSKTPLNEAQLDKVNPVYEATLGGRIIRDRLWFFGAGRYFKSSTNGFLAESTIPYVTATKEPRYEVKLTGQITPKHSLVASYLDNKQTVSGACFISCFNVENLYSRSTPNTFRTAHYNGILTSNLLVELGYSKKTFAFVGEGGTDPSFAGGTWGYDENTGDFFGAPVFCATSACNPETRNNKDYNLKSTYYLATKSLGTHNIVGGVDEFAEQRNANNFQSASGFEIYVFNSPTHDAAGNALATIMPGDFIQYTPILSPSLGSNIKTDSLYVNDKWDLSSHLNFNLGVRYDKNNVEDSSHNKTSNDHKISPRLGMTYDVRGDGKLRFNAGYAEYVSHIQETIGGSGASAAGNPSYIDFNYDGPAITNVPYVTAFQMVNNWFQSVGGISNTAPCTTNPPVGPCIIGQAVPGVSTIINTSLISPNVREFTGGVGSQVGSNGFVRFDYINRNWKDFYGKETDSTTGTVTDSLGNVFDLSLLGNSPDAKRKYTGGIIQAGYRFNPRINLGGNLTISKTTGNFISETSGSGPVPDASTSYPEYKAFAQNSPNGPLDGVDQKYKARIFLTAEQPTPIGRLTLGILERYDSGTPFSEIITVADQAFVTNPGYLTPPSTVSYYINGRGNHRWDNTTATDLSLTYALPITRASFYVKGDLLNAFNQHAVIGGNTTVLSATSSSCHQTVGANIGARCATFNPFTQTPVQGVNYQFGSHFGQATAPGNFETTRTYRFAVGVRF